MKTCSVSGCEKPYLARGLCTRHYALARRTGTLPDIPRPKRPKTICTIPDCGREHAARGLCDNHYRLWQKNGDPLINLAPTRGLPLEERFALYVDRDGPMINGHPELGPCHLWTANTDGAGYGRIQVVAERGKKGRALLAHRVAWELFVGPIPGDLQPDHLCHTFAIADCLGGVTCPHRPCVSVLHLELVTPEENRLRGRINQNVGKTVCINGHDFTPENTYWDKRGRRSCQECRRRLTRESKARKRA